MDRHLTTLEFDKILDTLSSYAHTARAKEQLLALRPERQLSLASAWPTRPGAAWRRPPRP